MALTIIQLHINFIIHPRAFLIRILIQTYIHFVYYYNFLLFILLCNLLFYVMYIF